MNPQQTQLRRLERAQRRRNWQRWFPWRKASTNMSTMARSSATTALLAMVGSIVAALIAALSANWNGAEERSYNKRMSELAAEEQNRRDAELAKQKNAELQLSREQTRQYLVQKYFDSTNSSERGQLLKLIASESITKWAAEQVARTQVLSMAAGSDQLVSPPPIHSAAICKSAYFDGDGDGFGLAEASISLCDDKAPAAPAGYTLISGDCCDQDNKVFPGQAEHFEATNACGTFDYNCDKIATLQVTTRGRCGGNVFVSGGCEASPEGWDGSVPTCGAEGRWLDDCDSGGFPPSCNSKHETSRRVQSCF
jgi:hypothetical protein